MRARIIVGWNVRRVRVAQKVSQERLAFDSGVDRSYVGGLERGDQNPSVDLLERLAETLGVDIAEFFTKPAKTDEPPKSLKGGRPAASDRK